MDLNEGCHIRGMYYKGKNVLEYKVVDKYFPT